MDGMMEKGATEPADLSELIRNTLKTKHKNRDG